MVAPIFQKYVQPNATIYNPSGLSVIVGNNTLTGGKQFTEFPQGTSSPDGYMKLHLEFKPDIPKTSPKEGAKTGSIILQGRIYYEEDYYGVKDWYKAGGTYFIDVDFLGKGRFYALEQIKSNMVTESKYFGFPILGYFVRLNGAELP